MTQNEVTIERIVMWSDNAGQQYKSCKVFDSLSKFKNIPVMCNYFCAKHGKAEADGAIGHLSMHLDAVVRLGSCEFTNAEEILWYCDLKFTIHTNNSEMCCHWQRHYFEVSSIKHDQNIDCKTVKGTLSFHSVCSVGVPGIIEVHESSCFCEPCFLNEPGNFKNAWLVERFAWVSVYNKEQVKDDIQNKLWDSYSLPYRHKKALFLG